MKATLVLGITLLVLGIGTLSYFASPVRFLISAYVPHHVDLRIPIAGVFMLAIGIALLFLCRSRTA